MGFRFRKSFKILPGVRLNVSKSGTSVTVGGRGVSTNLSKNGRRTTIGLPGSGLSHSTKHANSSGGGAGIRLLKLALWVTAIVIVAAFLLR